MWIWSASFSSKYYKQHLLQKQDTVHEVNGTTNSVVSNYIYQ